MLAEAMALSASLSKDSHHGSGGGGPGQPLLSPSRFLQLASLPVDDSPDIQDSNAEVSRSPAFPIMDVSSDMCCTLALQS